MIKNKQPYLFELEGLNSCQLMNHLMYLMIAY